MNRTGKNTTGWARRLTALLVTACLVMAMALPVYAEVDPLPDAPDEVELLEDEQGTASGEDTVPPEQNAATPVPDAATPEPEQSAEPEQPAPTETLEPTAEPTPTPEPAATATATPVPTVTPTATPEPTEQPQKMYAAESVDNVQAVSEGGVPATYTLYFAVPKEWSNFTSVKIYAADSTDTNQKGYTLEMQEDGETDDGRKIYSALLNKKEHYQWGGLGGLEFHEYNGNQLVAKVVIAGVDNKPRTWLSFKPEDKERENYISGNCYDGDTKKWSTYTVRHNHFANNEMFFENKTSGTLTNVQACFYEPKDNGNGELNPVGNSIALNIDPGSTATFTIPDKLCSYVQFTWVEDNSTKSSKFYNFYGEAVSGDESFTYSNTKNCFIYTGEDNVRWGIANSFLIYYDATFSKLPTTGKDDTNGNFSIPKADQSTESTVYYCLKGENGKSIGGEMSRIKDTDYYAADVPDGYTEIVFSSYPLSSDKNLTDCGNNTDWEKIPLDDYKEPCFYADTNDDTIYHSGPRGGYWAPKDTPRDAEKWKKTKVVDIDDTAKFTEEPDTKYVTSTLYDYYTDYELNGKNRDNYGGWTGASHRTWVTFREFDQALSDYYSNYSNSNSDTPVPYPMYTGQFQPEAVGADGRDWGTRFSEIADTLNLYGYKKDKNLFMAVNNSTSDKNGKGLGQKEEKLYDETFQGLAGPELKNGKPIMNGTTDLAMPFFNEEFLQGENSKKAKLGNVYKEVSFPFTQDEVFKDTDDNEKGVKYWYFDSDKTTLYLKNDPDNGGYFLQKQDAQKSQSKNLKSDSTPVQVKKKINGEEKMVDTYGFFPFNIGASENQASTYNYGFGAKLQFQFTLTSDGTVKDDNGNNIPIKFFFSGDDDVWVYIDGKLALDVGGDHGKASGLLEFGADTNGNNNYTSYVSDIKESNNTVYGSGAEKTVTYLGNKITFKYKSKETTTLKPGTHTLTMYYMERGMWESNMAVAFNFPDNNELQVQKIVDKKDVNEWFKSCFDTPDLFAFTIQNQATHYRQPDYDASIDSDVKPIELNTSDVSCKPATENSTGNIFEPTTELGGAKALHWYAKYQDTNPPSKWRSLRYGILTLKNAIDISQMRYLTFDIYAKSESGQGELSLGNLYLELLDTSERQKGCLGTTCLNGTTYGTVTLANDKWITIKLDLYKLNAVDKFDLTQVKTIRVGDNYPRHIYFKDFVFSAQAKATTKTGFTTKQEDIPVYGSIKDKGLKNAAGAQFTSDQNNYTHVVDENGQFMLQNGETVTFSDQFRRGSYISLKETLSPNLYDTTWTVFENDEAVQSYGSGNTVKGDTKNLNGQAATESQPGPDDGRTEVYDSRPDIKNDGYTGDKKPDANTIVFRSYKDPDEENTSSLTKLKVQFVNKVKTGNLVIKKAAASDEVDLIKGKYTFNVTFTNVGDEGLEQGPPIEKQVTIDMSSPKHEYVIEGIPIGTRFRIEEVTPEDKSHLQGVSVTGGGDDTQEVDNTYVQGSISGSGTNVIATFTNTMHELINIDFTKTWVNANGDPLEDGLPSEIYIQLQRRKTKNDPWQAVRYPDATISPEYVTVKPNNKGWDYPFVNLDKFDVNDSAKTNYEYRIVEGTVDEKGNFTEVEPNETITIGKNNFTVTAEATPKSETNSGDGSTGNTATANGGTITGGSGTIVLTNKLQNPKFVLDIIKQDANNEKNLLDGVEFKLEKLKQATSGETQWEVDASYKFDNNDNLHYLTGTTGDYGKITNNPFKDLKPGRYRLTETKAHPGYNLLSKSIDIEFTQDGMYKIDDGSAQKATGDAASGYTVTLPVLNRKTPELPHTGADAPSLWLLIGMPLAVAGLLIFTFRYNRKGGRRH